MAAYRKLGRTSSQRKALLRNQVTTLLYHGKIVTTEAKAKEIRCIAESLIANENEGRRIFEKVEESKVLDYVRSVVTIEKKKISLDKFQKLQ